LWAALRRVARPERPLDLLVAVWPLMVGQRLAAQTRPAAWDKGTLEVAVGEREWQTQLERMAEPVRAQINRWWGCELVREVRFVYSRAFKSSARRPHRPSTRPGEPRRKAKAEDKLEATLKELQGPLAGIADDELRDLIARVAAHYLDKQKAK